MLALLLAPLGLAWGLSSGDMTDFVDEARDDLKSLLLYAVGSLFIYMLIGGTFLYLLTQVGFFKAASNAVSEVASALGIREIFRTVSDGVGGLVKLVTG